MENKVNYDEIYLTKPNLDYALNPNLTVPGADFLSRKISEFEDHVVFAHKIHYKVGSIVMPYYLTTFSIYNINDYRKDNTPITNHLHAFKPTHELNKNHVVTFKTNTGMQIVQPATYTILNADKSYFQFESTKNNIVIEDSKLHSGARNINHMDVVNRILHKSGLLSNSELAMTLKKEIESLKNDMLYYKNQIEKYTQATNLHSNIELANRTPSLVFPILFKKSLAEYVNNENIKKHIKQIEFFTNEKIVSDKNGNYKLSNKQIKELFISSLYDEIENLMGEHTLSEETLESFNAGYKNTKHKLLHFNKALENLVQNKQQKESLTEDHELEIAQKR